MAKKVLVTGASGYIGRHVVARLCNCGAEVIAVSRSTQDVDTRATRVNMDIFKPDTENIYRELGEPEVCIHMAWKDGFVHQSDSHMEMLSSHYTFLKNMMDIFL